MAKQYNTKKEAKSAITGFASEAAAKKDAKKACTTRKKSTIAGLNIGRLGATGSGDMSLRIRFRCSESHSHIKDFSLDIQEYSSVRKKWSQRGNALVTLSKDSYVKEGKNIIYTYTFDAQNDDTITQLSVRVKPNSLTRQVTRKYQKVVEKKVGKNTKYELQNVSVSVDVAYFNETSWSETKKITSPAVTDSEDALKKLAYKKPDQLSDPTAELLSNGSIEVTFDAIDPSGADTCRLVYRCADGKYATDGVELTKTHKTIKEGVTRFVDTTVEPGHEYRYYVRAHNNAHGLSSKGEGGGPWSDPPSLPADLSDPVRTAPVWPISLTAAASGNDGVKVVCKYEGYAPALQEAKIYYADSLEVLRTNTTQCDSVDVVVGGSTLQAIVTGLESGTRYWFAIWLSTGDQEQQHLFIGDPTDTTRRTYPSCLVSTVPEPPTLMPIPKAIVAGTTQRVEWLHNPTDGSEQTVFNISILATLPGGTQVTDSVTQTSANGYCDLAFPESSYPDGTELLIKVRTKGASSTYSEYSNEVSSTVYHRASVLLTISDAGSEGDYGRQVSTLPLALSLNASLGQSAVMAQSVIEWRVILKAYRPFEYTDLNGDDTMMPEGAVIAEVTVSEGEDDFTQPTQEITISALDAVFVNGAAYEITAYALMDSGLEAEPYTAVFDCAFAGGISSPSASVMQLVGWAAGITPVCFGIREPEHDYVYDAGTLRVASVPEGYSSVLVTYGDELLQAHTYIWTPESGFPDSLEMTDFDDFATFTSVVACESDGTGPQPIEGEVYDEPAYEDVSLSVYRIERDGSLSLVVENLANTSGVMVVDQHPTFGDMEYRIIANSLATDEIEAADVSGENDWDSILIQWNEAQRRDNNYNEEDGIEFDFEWVELPWNIRVSQSSSKDVALKNYIGRQHPVALYGTQVGDSGSWSCEIVKNEEDWELRQLRKLSRWMGDCWVREPSGLSYPANVNVTITRSYDSMAVTVDLEVTKVDGYYLD